MGSRLQRPLNNSGVSLRRGYLLRHSREKRPLNNLKSLPPLAGEGQDGGKQAVCPHTIHPHLNLPPRGGRGSAPRQMSYAKVSLHGSDGCPTHVAGASAVCFNWAVMTNTLYYGDNLDILREHVPDESVDLVYLDPPFNSNASYNVLFREQTGEGSPAQIKAFTDTWEWTQESQRTFENEIMLNPATPANVREMIDAFRQFIGSNAMMAYLVMMTPRLVELRRVLKPTGSIYLHCDPTASHYLKVLMDSVFGKESFRNEITWRRYGAHNDVGQGSTRFGRVHDIILLYGKTDSVTWNQEFTSLDERYVKNTYRHVDEETGRRFTTTPLTGPGGAEKGNPVYEWNGHVRAWRYSLETMKQLDAEGRLYYSRTGYPRRKLYLDESRGVPVQDMWADIYSLSGSNTERLGLPHPEAACPAGAHYPGVLQ